MKNEKRLIEQAGDILDKWDFFYGQRAGREQWGEKPREVQDEDIANFCRDLSVVRSAIVDAVEVVHGEWVIERSPVEAEFKCSECDYLYIDADSYAKEKYNYCPNCGAKMDGERKDNE